jgi:Na+-transporting NADH:ubiquinone oxidoreductase subunit C
MQKDDRKVVLFATVVCVVCSLLLSLSAEGLKGRKNKNIELDRKFNVLKAFGHEVEDGEGKRTITDQEIENVFEKHIAEVVLDAETGDILEGETSTDISKEDLKKKIKLPLYRWTDNGEVTRYAFPISGYGLWSTLYGYMALERDLATIIGVTFYAHKETPGLGGECSEPWFMSQFAGKKVWADGDLVDFQVVKGGVDSKYPDGNDHAVDGISAATITSNGIQTFIRQDMANYDKYFAQIRGT